jgi:hypothetical protein
MSQEIVKQQLDALDQENYSSVPSRTKSRRKKRLSNVDLTKPEILRREEERKKQWIYKQNLIYLRKVKIPKKRSITSYISRNLKIRRKHSENPNNKHKVTLSIVSASSLQRRKRKRPLHRR